LKFLETKRGHRITLCLLLVLSLLVKLNLSRDQFLHEWDERYHALVAKNLLQHPLKPTLYDQPIHTYDIADWTCNHIWLSKPPIPLWCMAASISVFGNNEWAVRLPGLLFALGCIILCYRIGRSLHSCKMGLLMAGLMAMHGVLSDLSSGRLSSDGVECCFLFFCFLGAHVIFQERTNGSRMSRYIWVGVITGIAVLSKWQPGLLLLLLLGIYRPLDFSWRFHLAKVFIAGIVAFIIVFIWIGYGLLQFPTEMRWMLHAMFSPFTDTNLNPDGSAWSYVNDFGKFFGYPIFGLVFLYCWLQRKNWTLKALAIAVWALLPVVIFSFAEVKRGTYLMISAPAVFYLIGWGMEKWKTEGRACQYFRKWAALICIISIGIYAVEKLYLFRPRSLRQAWCDEMKSRVYEPGSIVYEEPHFIELMFYHDVIAYPFSKSQAPPLMD
jgi:4-amino-4-deoxy-L-arabinose transferase